MNEQERAEEHLRTIRRLMERATIYRAISAPTALVGGLLSLAASGIFVLYAHSRFHPENTYQTAFVSLWIAVLLFTTGANALFIFIGARRRNEPMFSASMKTALYALMPALLAGGIFTLVLSLGGGDWSLLLMAMFWSVFYGLGLLATSHFAPRSLTMLGWAFLLTGLATSMWMFNCAGLRGLVIFEGEGQLDWYATLFMAATFGLYHLIYAACAWPRKEA